MVLGFTPASAARSRTDGSRSPGGKIPATMRICTPRISWA